MDYSIVNVNQKPNGALKIFFDDRYGHFIRIDEVSAGYEKAKNLKEFSEGNTWFSKEIDMKEDKTKFDQLADDTKRAFQLNIIYQTLMDSGVTKGVSDCIVQCVSTPMWDMLYRRIAIEEAIHAESYSYCLNEVVGVDITDILDLVYSDTMVQRRMENEAALFSDLHKLMDKEVSIEEKRDALMKVLIGVYCLEFIKFPFSFFVTFTINDSNNNAIPGFVQNIRLIAHDELNTHVPTFLELAKILKSDDSQGFSNWFKTDKFEKTLRATIDEVVKQEIEWAKYLFDNKNVPGLNSSIAEYFINWRAYLALRNLDLDTTEYSSYTGNSITNFFENYRSINKQNAALQETTNTSYQKGTLKNDL